MTEDPVLEELSTYKEKDNWGFQQAKESFNTLLCDEETLIEAGYTQDERAIARESMSLLKQSKKGITSRFANGYPGYQMTQERGEVTDVIQIRELIDPNSEYSGYSLASWVDTKDNTAPFEEAIFKDRPAMTAHIVLIKDEERSLHALAETIYDMNPYTSRRVDSLQSKKGIGKLVSRLMRDSGTRGTVDPHWENIEHTLLECTFTDGLRKPEQHRWRKATRRIEIPKRGTFIAFVRIPDGEPIEYNDSDEDSDKEKIKEASLPEMRSSLI